MTTKYTGKLVKRQGMDQFIYRVCKKTGVGNREARAVMREFRVWMGETIGQGGRVYLEHFGIFKATRRDHRGFDSVFVSFKAAKQLKRIVKQNIK